MENSTYLFPEIDFEKSIKKEKLVYVVTIGTVYDYFKLYLIACFLIGVITLFIPLFLPTGEDKNRLLFALAIGCLIAWDIFMILDLIFLNKLVCVSGSDPETNKDNMKKLLKAMFNDIESAYINENSIRYFNSPDLGLFKRITTLYYENKVYINITTLGRRNTTSSSFNSYLNYLKCKRIASEFSRLGAAKL